MPQIKVFRCPSCGASISTDGESAHITCQFCGNTVMVPEEMRVKRPEPAVPPPYVPPVFVTSTPIVTVGGGSGARRGGSAILTMTIIGVVACVTLGIIASVVLGVGAAGLGLAPAVTAMAGLSTLEVVATVAAPIATPTPGFAEVALTWGGEGTGPGKFDDPRSIAVDGQGNVYVGEYTIARVQKFDANGQFVTTWMTESSIESAPLRNLAADRTGSVYVARAGRITKYDAASGSPALVLQDDTGFDDVVVLPDGRLLACACFGGNDLVFLSADGEELNRIPEAITSITGDTLSFVKLAVDGLGNIFVLSQKDSAVFLFNADGEFIDRFGADGDEPGQFTAPSTIAVDNQGRIYVTDFKGIQVFSGDGTYLDVFDVPGGGYINGLAFSDQGELYAASNSNEITKFTLADQ